MPSQRARDRPTLSSQPSVFSDSPLSQVVDNSVRGSSVKPTPSQRKPLWDTPEAAKKRVRVATKGLSGERCFIENVHEHNAPEYAHCLARATRDGIIDCLEYSWGLEYGTLNVDTRENIFILGQTLHYLFDHNQWLLLPETDIINEYYNAANTNTSRPSPAIRRAAFPQIRDGPYTYRLMSRALMRYVPIHREEPPEPPRDHIIASDFTFLSHPLYNGMTFTSHVHPHFVICNAGQKLDDALRDFLKIYEHTADLPKVLDIYDAWLDVDEKKTLFDFRNSPGGGDPRGRDTGSQASSQQTRKERVNIRKRPAPREQGAGSPTSQQGQAKKQRSGGNHDAAWMLDENTLYELDSGRSNSGKGVEILQWATHVAKSAGKMDEGGLRGDSGMVESSAEVAI